MKIYLVTFKTTYPKGQTNGHSSQADKVNLLESFLRIFIVKVQIHTCSYSVLLNYYKFCLILWNNLFRHQPLLTMNIPIVTFRRQSISSANGSLPVKDHVTNRYMYLNTTHPHIFANEISSPPLTLTLFIILYCIVL
jgi:hypothetical protein